MTETVCAIVVTYNRKELLLECLTALKRQIRPLNAVYILDNASIDGTPKTLFKNGYINELPPENLNTDWETTYKILNLTDNAEIIIHYVRMYENTGGSGGFYEGVKRAHEKGYEWLWLMDDDCEADRDALKKLSNFFYFRNTRALATIVKDEEGIINYKTRGYFNFENIFPIIQEPLSEKSYYSNDFVEIDMASFVGLLINRKLVDKIGFPKKEFFIYHDDVEYCLRINKISKILLIIDSIIIHKDKQAIQEKKGVKNRILYEKLWITYYGKRNLIWLGKIYSVNHIKFYLILFKIYFLYAASIVLYDDNKFKRLQFLTESYLDGLKGNFDNDKPKKILYTILS